MIRAANEAGKKIQVFADETRPWLQGARLTAWELQHSGIDVTLICDNMAGLLMKQGKIQLVVTGAFDSVALLVERRYKEGLEHLQAELDKLTKSQCEILSTDIDETTTAAIVVYARQFAVNSGPSPEFRVNVAGNGYGPESRLIVRSPVGITLHAQDALGDVVFVDLPEVGRTYKRGEVAGVVESVKAAADIYMPVEGEVVEINKRAAESDLLVYVNINLNEIYHAVEGSDVSSETRKDPCDQRISKSLPMDLRRSPREGIEEPQDRCRHEYHHYA